EGGAGRAGRGGRGPGGGAGRGEGGGPYRRAGVDAGAVRAAAPPLHLGPAWRATSAMAARDPAGCHRGCPARPGGAAPGVSLCAPLSPCRAALHDDGARPGAGRSGPRHGLPPAQGFAVTAPLLEVQGVSKVFWKSRSWTELLLGRPQHSLRAVRDVSLALARGETLGLVGESGSGKTTLGRCIAGFFAPTTGEIRLDGRPVSGRHYD